MTARLRTGESAILTRLRTLSERGKSLASESRTLGPLMKLGSRVTRRGRQTAEDAGNATTSYTSTVLASSRFAGTAETVTATLGEAARQSRLAALPDRGQQFVEGSWLYRWLTAEPEPDVVVIDLRETLTVGPWLRVIQRALDWLLPAAVSSAVFRAGNRTHELLVARPVQIVSLLVGVVAVGLLVSLATAGAPPSLVAVALGLAVLALAGSRVTWSWEQLRETRGYQLLADAFEPPEPPEPARDRATTPSESSDTQTDDRAAENSTPAAASDDTRNEPDADEP